ncbi:O-methyltransferase family protein [Rasamsonia emersonii CBS 393.64]|uniref:O-methyltransferase family protein n=1 Tax=Rasamsonia emersonii (strain ATCC 16479 / CBS 393.64 / IMI 116815) TaxID=1408163 RepID=A0A0F4Z0X5_RASE3|nr:O-methyltransferase family protein [Rasamsonia emersonii CBS 393.64]KKA24025.1 O-methyltransferase family protein [Rasamsonia emersonii CBS 393.64]
MGLLQLLAAKQGKSLTAAELANASGYDELFIARVMRIMTAIGFADETGYQTYTANAKTVCQSDPGSAGGLILSNEMIYPLASKMRQYLRQNKPCNISQTPPAYDFAMGETVWETLKKDAEWKKGFDDNMTARNKMLSIPWHVKYPAKERLVASRQVDARPVVIVDIGGNQGVDLQRFADSFPDLDCELILQDLPETLKGIPGPLDPRIKPTVYDFFTEQPVKGADIYYLKSVLHDWDDIAARKILSNTAKAMAPHSRLLINEIVLADTNETLVRADMDMLMLFLSNGMERTYTQWKELLARVEPPLRLVEVWSVPVDQQSVIEACLASR